MTLFVTRLRGDSAPPPDRSSTRGRVHIVDLEQQRGGRWAFSGVPTVCGRELIYLTRPRLWAASEILWVQTKIEPDMLDWRCKLCFGQ